jgi:hypothetical protein
VTDEYLRNLYEQKSSIELLLIATNQDGGYTNEAVETARSLIFSRYRGISDLEEAWRHEIQRLSKLADGCSLCQDPKVAYSKEFYLCTPKEVDILPSIPGFLTQFAFGIGYRRYKYRYVTLEFKLCQRCLAGRTRIKRSGQKELKMSNEDYYLHPLVSVFYHFGYTELRTQD